MVLHLLIPDVVVIKKVLGSYHDDQKNEDVPYYKLTVATSDDAGTLSCSKDVFDKAREGQKHTLYFDTYDVIRPYKGNDSTKLKVIDIK